MEFSPFKDAREAIANAVRNELEARGYDNYPDDEDLFNDLIDDITERVVAVLKSGSVL